jgi:hypothetical protein
LCSWGPEVLLPEKTAKFLATNAHVRTLDTLGSFLPGWVYRNALGSLVIERIKDADTRWYESQGTENPWNAVPKSPEEKRAQYNANRREKRRKLSEVKKMAAEKAQTESKSIESEASIKFINETNPDMPTKFSDLAAPSSAPCDTSPADLIWCPQSPSSLAICKPPRKSRKSSQPIASSSRVKLNSAKIYSGGKAPDKPRSFQVLQDTVVSPPQSSIESMQFTFQITTLNSVDNLPVAPLPDNLPLQAMNINEAKPPSKPRPKPRPVPRPTAGTSGEQKLDYYMGW